MGLACLNPSGVDLWHAPRYDESHTWRPWKNRRFPNRIYWPILRQTSGAFTSSVVQLSENWRVLRWLATTEAMPKTKSPHD